MLTYKCFGSEELARVKEIFAAERWLAYLRDDEKLKRAFDASLYTLGAFEDGRLIGFARCVGDGEHIVVVQDLIVDPARQRRGIGTALFRAVWDKYAEVRMFMVVTDSSDEVDNKFYQSFGMRPLSKGEMVGYFR